MAGSTPILDRTLSLAFALLGAAAFFALPYYLAYSPERLLGQGFALALFVDRLSWAAFPNYNGPEVIRAFAGIAFFVARGAVILFMAQVLLIQAIGNLVARALVDLGWPLVFDVALIAFFLALFVTGTATQFIAMIVAVIADIFGGGRARDEVVDTERASIAP